MISLPTDDPEGLLAAIKDAIDKRRIRTWSYDDDDDFTHTAEQWNEAAWLSPKIGQDGLSLYILAPKGVTISKQVYAVYHGRYIEMVLSHFDILLSGPASATPFPEGDDLIE